MCFMPGNTYMRRLNEYELQCDLTTDERIACNDPHPHLEGRIQSLRKVGRDCSKPSVTKRRPCGMPQILSE